MWPRRTCGFELYVVLTRTSEGLTSLRVLEGAHCRFMAPGDLALSILVEILHNGEGGDAEQVARTSKQISLVCDCSSFSQLTCVYILLALNCLHLYMLKWLRRERRASGSNLKTILPCLQLLVSLLTCVLYLACSYCSYLLYA